MTSQPALLDWLDYQQTIASTDWMERAACGGTSEPDQFYPEHERDRPGLARTKLICRSCPVQDECLQYSLDEQIRDGIWGGLTETERWRLARRNGRPIPRP